ncbi:MAG: ThiF family adenylyltransferase [Planctomycetes bacterium]|nr:ThiF family adenylyltransferase [Planctomycetota bacterium]MCB9934836.1 ThiF family adenylyltransferase [Planctomycetota bacterium]
MTRYSRQELFSPIGPEGQRRIRESRVLLVGCGALGTHLAEFCVRAGVGSLTIVDRDIVEFSNLQRQSLFTEDDARAALPKAEAARRALAGVNSEVEIRAEVRDFNFRNAEKLAHGASIILDASDNFETRFLINDLAVKHGLPWVYAGCVSAKATCMPVLPGKTACLTCLLEDQPAAGGETCDTTGIIMPAVLQAVAWSSVVALKILSGNAGALLCKMLTVDLWTGERTSIDASRHRSNCPTCGGKHFPWLEGKRASKHAALCGRDSVQISPEGEFDYKAARERIGKAAKLSAENDYLLRAEFEGLTVTLYKDGRALVHGTDDIDRAKAVYARVVG